MEERPKSPADYIHELNSRILENPTRRMLIIQEFYRERVNAGDRETADIVLTIRSMMMDANERNVPSWFQPAGFCTGILTLLFFMAIVLISILGHEIPPTAKFPVLAVFALGCAFSVSFLTGDAVASGKIPFFGNQNPLAISATGGVAVLIIILTIGYYIYLK